MNGLIIPAADAVGLPAPVWLLRFLLVLTFILHVLPMSLVLGGSLIAVWTHLTDKKQEARQLVAHLAGILPSAVAFTITLGIAPLLFVQLLYGTLFYTSSILMGFPWLGTLALLLVGYYSLYIYVTGTTETGESPRTSRLWAGLLSTLCFLGVAYLITNNLSLMVTPYQWAQMYAADPSGWGLRLPVLTVLPRYLHALAVALTIAAAYIVLYGSWRARTNKLDDMRYGREASLIGAKWLAAALALQAGAGLWYLSSLNATAQAWLLGDDLYLTLSLVLGTLSMASGGILLVVAAQRNALSLSWAGGAGVLLGTVFLAVTRHLLENRTAVQFLPEGAWQLSPQWGVFALFALILVAGLGLVAWMVLRVLADLKGGAVPFSGALTGKPETRSH